MRVRGVLNAVRGRLRQPHQSAPNTGAAKAPERTSRVGLIPITDLETGCFPYLETAVHDSRQTSS